MAQLYDIMKPESKYWDRKNYDSLEAYNAALQISATVYVGNLSFYTQQSSVKELFSRAGNVKDVIMGIDNQGHPCGFCFVIFQSKQQAQMSVQYISKTRLGGRIIRVDLDPGFKQGRQKGRGISGQQRRDDFRTKDDPERPHKKVATGYQNSGRGDYNRERGNSHRGDRGDRGDRGEGHRDRGQGGYRGRNDGHREDRGDRGDRGEGYRGGDRQRGGQRRQWRGRDNNRGGDRGQRRDYRDNRQPRQNREPKEQPKQQVEQKQQEY